MKETDGVTLRSIRWSELFPWLAIGRCFRLAIAPRMLIFGALGSVINLFGWWTLAWVFGADHKPNPWFLETFHGNTPFEVINRHLMYTPAGGPISAYMSVTTIENWLNAASISLAAPFHRLFSVGPLKFQSDVIMLILASLLSVAVWGFLGGAISRIAAVQLAGDERLGFIPAARWAGRKWLSYCAAPLFPLLGVVLAAIPLWFVGLLQQVDFGILITGPFWFLALACGFFMALLLLGLAYGFPLMWATISVEGTDSFDALSRTYAYVLQRPIRYAWYVFVAGVLGVLGLLFVNAFAAAVIWMASWGTSWGCGGQRAALIFQAANDMRIPVELGSASAQMGVLFVGFWSFLVKCLALGYMPAYFWTASTSIYLLLRRDVDATETDEVYLDAESSQNPTPLPPITTDAAGAPQLVTNGDTPSVDGQKTIEPEPKSPPTASGG